MPPSADLAVAAIVAPAPPCRGTQGCRVVRLSAGESLQAAIDGNPEGTVFVLGAGVWHQQQFEAKSHDQFVGDAHGGTILTGDDKTSVLTSDNGATGVVFKDITVEHYASPLQMGAIHGVVGWSFIDDTFRDNAAGGLNIGHDTVVQGGHYIDNGEAGILGYKANNAKVIGAEIAGNNTAGNSMDWEAGGLKLTASSNVQLLDNYVHDNHGDGLWGDIADQSFTIAGNTVVNNAYHGIQYEISSGASIHDNTVSGNGGSGPVPGAQIFISSSGGADVYDNTVTVPGGRGDGIVVQAESRPGAVATANDQVHDNTIAFAGSNGVNGLRSFGGTVGSGNSFDHNTYYVAASGDAHWMWLDPSAKGWSAYRSATGQDGASTLHVGTAPAPSGKPR